MTVQCPRCRTQYKIPPARIHDPRPVFKCNRCSHVFASQPERGPRSTKSREDKNLSLPFTSRKDASSLAEDAPTLRSVRDPEPDEELLDEAEAEERDADDEESGEGATDAEDSDAAGDEDDEDEAEEQDEEQDEPAKPARRRRRAAAEDDATEPAFARAERERAAERERERERQRVAAETERAAAEKERARLAAEKERERQRAAAEREKERARAAADRERARAAEARRRERATLELQDDGDVDDEGPDDLGDEDDEPRRPVLRASESKQRRAPINPRRSIRSASATTTSRSPLRPVAIGVATVAAVYLGAALWMGSSSEAAIATLSQVPVLGRLLGGDHLLVWRLQLTDVDGGLDQIKGGRPAYVVSGRAVNTSNEDLRVIEIEGRLLASGVEQRRQTVYAANQQRKTIQDLSPPEVDMLLRLEPNRRFVIRPGESASFLLVFPNPPPGTTEVTCRVIDARSS